MGIETALVVGSIVTGVAGAAAPMILQDKVEPPKPPDPGIARKQAAEEAKARQQSFSRFMNRSQQLGPVQLKAPGLRI